MCFMYTLAVTLSPYILYTVTHSLPPHAFFTATLLFNAVLYKLCVYVCVWEHVCVFECVYILNALSECVWASLWACEPVVLHDPSQAWKPTSDTFSNRMVMFIAVVVICGFRWWNVCVCICIRFLKSQWHKWHSKWPSLCFSSCHFII